MPEINTHNADCLTHLKTMPANSIESVVTDPPYGISFMDKGWDKGVPPVEIWAEVYRVLKPGAHALVACGTRTQHRMAVNLEDAGFEIRDLIFWLYGCLSEDTEILTKDGWKSCDSDIEKHSVLCYDKETDSFEYNKPSKKYLYENQHTAYRIQSDKTDQIVSRNHRVLTEQGGGKTFESAEQVAQEQEATVPVLESLCDLPEYIYDRDKRASCSKYDLLQKMHGQTKQPKQHGANKTNRTKGSYGNRMCRMWNGLLQVQMPHKKIRKSLLLKSLQWESTGQRVGETCSQRSREYNKRRGETPKTKNAGQPKSLMERWHNLQAQKRLLLQRCVNKICEVFCGLFGYGTERWVCYGASLGNGTTSWPYFEQDGSGASYQPQPTGQQAGESNAFPNQPGTQTIRSTRAKITETEYNGRVWCVEVPTGAFVARRNGKIFITGNSGFPKSQNIGKQIDKMEGNERQNLGYTKRSGKKIGTYGAFQGGNKVTKGDTQWEGWGTALKPAAEIFTLVRKPIDERNIALNVLKHGTGGINIDGCRVTYQSESDKKESFNKNRHADFNSNNGVKAPSKGIYHGDYRAPKNHETNKGRFPANVIHDGSEEVVSGFPYSHGPGNKRESFCGQQTDRTYRIGASFENPNYYESEGGSTSRFFYCAKASKKDRTEQGQVTNNHPTVKPTNLMQYLIRLITPPEGTVLDPFMGSGTTGKAAIREDKHFVGIEKDKDSYDLACERIRKNQNTGLL